MAQLADRSDLKLAEPRAAYIHVPFCRHRCGYCNFTLVARRGDLVESYLQAIEMELGRLESPHEVDTLYLGGGTPTFLKPAQLRRLISSVLRWHPLSRFPSVHARRSEQGAEFTVEANPADVDAATADTLAEMGVTRVSLGGQSFRSEKLRLLERDHGPGDIERAVALIRARGMHTGIDLIFATPEESLAQWAADVDAAIALAPQHVSTYGLTFERGTAFWNRRLRGELVEIDENLQREMYGLAIDRLTSAGFEHYEVSNFARPGCRSRHNETYWRGDGYFAAGPGAARYVAGVREINHRSTTTWLKRVAAGESPVAERESLPAEARARELLVFGLRRMGGVARQEFAARCGHTIEELVDQPLKKFVRLGLLADNGDRVQLTREGLFVSDAIWPEML